MRKSRATDYSKYHDWRDPETLIPYDRNIKTHNDRQVRNIANSIKRFGWQQEVVITQDNVVVIGHGRRLAALKLGCKVPVKVIDQKAEDLTDADIRELRIADNQVNAETGFDTSLLELELEGLNFEGFEGFEWDIGGTKEPEKQEEPDDDGYFGDEKERTYNSIRLNEFNPFRCAGKWDMPTIPRCDCVPDSMIPFHHLVMSRDSEVDTVHFFIDDYRFERIWREPFKYADILKRRTKAVCMPDFSLYTDMPAAGKIWNCYRSKLIAQIFSDAGLTVIPAPAWAGKESFAYAFDGLPKHSVLAISTRGIHNSGDEPLELFTQGMKEVMKRLQPSMILQYGADIPGFDFGVPVKKYETFFGYEGEDFQYV